MPLSRAQMPSLQELTAFEAAGRHESFTRAADELSLTQSAVSKQIRELEATLGVILFERVKGRVVLTRTGAGFLLAARRILDDYATASHAMMASSGSERALKIGVLPTFATRWLIPRVADFLDRRPMVTLNMVTRPAPFDLAADSVDAAIHFGGPNWAQAEATYLCDENVIAVASPACRDRLALREPHDLIRATLLQQATRPQLWRDWFATTGFHHPAPFRGPLFDQFAMTSEAAAAGIGVALVPAFLVERELADGSLTVVTGVPPMQGNGAYYVVTPIDRQHDPDIAAFVAWLVEQAKASASERRAKTGR